MPAISPSHADGCVLRLVPNTHTGLSAAARGEMMNGPDVTDYLKLFRLYGEDLSSIYMESDDLRYKLLFEQIIALLLKQSEFNNTIPQPFKDTARNYSRGHPKTIEHFENAGHRNFMMSDLHDFIVLKAKVAGVDDIVTPQAVRR